MASPEDMREWLKKMHYSDSSPTNEDLNILLSGPMALIFQQVIKKVKPIPEVEAVRANILVNQIDKKQKHDGLEKQLVSKQLQMYREKHRLMEELNQLNFKSSQMKENIEHVMEKTKRNYVKIDETKERIRHNQKNMLMVRAEMARVEKDSKRANELLRKSEKLCNDEKGTKSVKETVKTIDDIKKRITQVISKHDLSSYPDPETDTTTKAALSVKEEEMSVRKALVIANRMCSSRKPQSQCNLEKRFGKNASIYSTPRHVTKNVRGRELHSNSSTIKKIQNKNDTGKKPMPLSLSLMNSYLKLVSGNKDIIKDIVELSQTTNKRFLIWCLLGHRQQIMKNPSYKTETNRRFQNMKKAQEKIPENIDLSKLHMHHIQNELLKHQSLLNVNAMSNILSSKIEQDELTMLQITKVGLEASVRHLQKSIKELNESKCIIDLEWLIKHLECGRNQIKEAVKQRDLNLCVLNDSAMWLKRKQWNILTKAHKKKSFIDLDRIYLSRNNANALIEMLQSTKYTQPNELLTFDMVLSKLTHNSCLQPEFLIHQILHRRNWYNRLKSLNSSRKQIVINVHYEDVDYSSQMKNLERAEMQCHETLRRSKDYNALVDFWLDCPLQNCISDDRTHEGKVFKDYQKIYEKLYEKHQDLQKQSNSTSVRI